MEKPPPASPNAYWFGPKTVGFGTGPTSWQGWLLTLALLVFVCGALWVSHYFSSPSAAGVFDLAAVIAGIAAYLWIAGKHTNPDSDL